MVSFILWIQTNVLLTDFSYEELINSSKVTASSKHLTSAIHRLSKSLQKNKSQFGIYYTQKKFLATSYFRIHYRRR